MSHLRLVLIAALAVLLGPWCSAATSDVTTQVSTSSNSATSWSPFTEGFDLTGAGSAAYNYSAFKAADGQIHYIIILNAFLDQAENGLYEIYWVVDDPGIKVQRNVRIVSENDQRLQGTIVWTDCGVNDAGLYVVLWENHYDGGKSIHMCSCLGGDWQDDVVVVATELMRPPGPGRDEVGPFELSDVGVFAHMTPYFEDYIWVIYQQPADDLWEHLIMRVDVEVDSLGVTLTPDDNGPEETGAVSDQPASYNLTAVSPIVQAVDNGPVYFTVIDRYNESMWLGIKEDPDAGWSLDSIDVPTAWPSIALDPDGNPWVFSQTGFYPRVNADSYTWIRSPNGEITANDVVRYDGQRGLYCVNQGVWTENGALITGVNRWGPLGIEGFSSTRWRVSRDSINADPPVEVWSLFNEDGELNEDFRLIPGCIAPTQLIAGVGDTLYSIVLGVENPEPHFVFAENTGGDHSFLIEGIGFDLEMEPQTEDEIGIFTPGGLCVGASNWSEDPIGLIAWMDDANTVAVEGFHINEAFSFRYWDCDEEVELSVRYSVLEGDELFTEDGITAVELVVTVPLTVDLAAGWGMNSCNVDLYDSDMQTLVDPILEDLILIKAGSGIFSWPARNFWWLDEWSSAQGYKIKMRNGAGLDFSGDPIPADRPLPLPAGWSMIAYYPNQTIDAVTAFRNIAGQLIIAKNGFGQFYLPDREFCNMSPCEPGQGFQVKLSEAVELVWNTDGDSLGSVILAPVALKHFRSVSRTADNMSLLIEAAPKAGEGAELGCFTEAGLCVGGVSLAGNSPWGAAVWEDDPTTKAIDGCTLGESLLFRIWDGEREHRVQTSDDDAVTYATDDLKLITLTADALLPDGFVLNPPHPNPFNSVVQIEFALGADADVSVGIYDLSGRLVQLLAQEKLPAGTYRRGWDAADRSSGLYFVRLSAAGQTRMVKMILLR